MRVLLDTCVVSENLRPNGERRVKDRVRALRSRDTFLSTITMGEIARGIALLDPGRLQDHVHSTRRRPGPGYRPGRKSAGRRRRDG